MHQDIPFACLPWESGGVHVDVDVVRPRRSCTVQPTTRRIPKERETENPIQNVNFLGRWQEPLNALLQWGELYAIVSSREGQESCARE